MFCFQSYDYLDFARSKGGAGAPIKADDGRIVTKRTITMKRNEQGG